MRGSLRAQGHPSNALFRMRFENGAAKYDFFVPCMGAPECRVPMPEAGWLAMASASADRQVTLTVTGTDGSGGYVATGDAMPLGFSPDAVRGGLYYWSTGLSLPGGSRGGGTLRMNFGERKARPFIAPNTPSNPNQYACSGCHSISRNGKVIAFTGGRGKGTLGVAPTDNPAAQTIASNRLEGSAPILDSSMMTLNPNGTRVLVSVNAQLNLLDTANGNLITTVPPASLGADMQGYFPEWSPDGTKIVLSLSNKRNLVGGVVGYADYDVQTGSIAILPVMNDSFGSATVVVPMGADFHFYPSWSPDGNWIAFASAPVGNGGGGSESQVPGVDSTYNTPNARLRLVASTGGTVYELGAATQGVGSTSTWPRFTPFSQLGGKVMFVAFNSKIDYGFLLKNAALIAAATGPDKKYAAHPQLWMFAIDFRRLGTGADLSSAPIWLPFQDVDQWNHMPFWTEVVACASAAGGVCGDGEMCASGVCVPKQP